MKVFGFKKGHSLFKTESEMESSTEINMHALHDDHSSSSTP